VEAWYRPNTQAVHAEAPAAEYLPAAQKLVAVDRPVVAQLLPVAQLTQLVASALGL
jgi:hypothetical protein